ncbi:hypothetical protein AKO1_014729 [Acrasis kona]|uniref:Novel toxin 11 domain-containing protein n=1 Tax=Acrasis kona TaxID=1008807 RepID=A0AAW2Z478_9EUKA
MERIALLTADDNRKRTRRSTMRSTDKSSSLPNLSSIVNTEIQAQDVLLGTPTNNSPHSLNIRSPMATNHHSLEQKNLLRKDTTAHKRFPIPVHCSQKDTKEDELSKEKDTSDQPIYYLTPEFQDRLENVKIQIAEEFSFHGAEVQFKRDARLWKHTLEEPGNEQVYGVMRRIFSIIRWGGFMYRTHSKTSNAIPPEETDTMWRWWHDSKIPIASALSHGSRIIIQLPKKRTKQEPFYGEDYGVDNYYDASEDNKPNSHGFWRWLITGDPKGDVSTNVSTHTNGSDAKKANKIFFKRLGATHALQYQDNLETMQQTLHVRNTRRQQVERAQLEGKSPPPLLQCINGDDSDYTLLLGGRRKVLHETKTMGVTFRDTKLFRTNDTVLKHHRQWGMNLPVGGNGYQTMTGSTISRNGEHGHLYLYYMSPKQDRFGGVMIGVEGSEYGKYDQGGGYHGLSARSPLLSPTFGYKWRGKDDGKRIPNLYPHGPAKYNGMIIDLTGSGWTHLMRKEKDWRDEYVMQTSQPVDDVKWQDKQGDEQEAIRRMTVHFGGNYNNLFALNGEAHNPDRSSQLISYLNSNLDGLL